MRKMEWAGRPNHIGGIPRRIVFMAVGAFAKAVASPFNSTSVQNAETLIRLVRSRPLGIPLITISNHMSTLDDPVMGDSRVFPQWMQNWHGKCIPITRGAGIYQEHMNEALERLSDGAWLHTFPEGKVSQEDSPIRRLKWGTASLIVRAPVTPIVLPIVHHGLEEVMPENFFFGRRPPFPLWNEKIKIVVGEPIEFDLPKLRQKAISTSRNLSFPRVGWPGTSPCGLDEAAHRCLFTAISEQIWAVLERLRNSLKHS